MRTFLIRGLLLTALAAAWSCPAFAQSQPVGGQRPARQKKSSVMAKTPVAKKSRYKIIPFLPFDQIAQLELGKRAKYVHELRKSIVVAEKIQNISIKSKYTSAQNDDFSYRSRWFALLMGHYAFAEGVDSVRDHCFYAGHLGEYDQNTEMRVPFHCKPEYKCVGANGPGVLCSVTMGVTASDPRSCIPMAASQHSTAECYKLKDELTQENKAKSEAAWKEAENYFFSKPADPDSFKKQAAAPEAADHLKALLDTSYDDVSYAETIKVLANYKKDHIAVPIKSVSGGTDENGNPRQFSTNYFTDDLDVKNIGTDNDQIQAAVEQKYAKQIEHCTRDLTADEMAQLNANGREQHFKDLAANSRNHAAELENIRYQLLDNMSSSRSALLADLGNNDQSNPNDGDEVALLNLCAKFNCRQGKPLANDPKTGQPLPTIMEVMENEECRDTAKQIMGVIGGFQKLIPDEAYTPSPAVKAESNYEIDPTGCSRNVSQQEHQLVNPGARCMVCMAEKTMEESSDNAFNGIQHNQSGKIADGYENKKMYTASTKWFALLSTMALQCGDSIADDTWIHPNTILAYMKTFGHCSSETYDWPADDQTPGAVKAEVKTWQENDHYKNPKTNKADETFGEHFKGKTRQDFEDVYGISLSDASNLFCDKKTIKHTLPCAFGLLCDKVKDVNPALKSLDWTGDARNRMAAFVANNQYKTTTPAKRALLNCVQKSLATARALYSNQSPTCLSTEKLSAVSKSDFANLLEDIYHGGTQVIFNAGSCYVAKQAEYDYRNAATHTADPNHDLCYACAINFVNTSKVKDTGTDFGRPTKLIEDNLKPVTGMVSSSFDIWYDGKALNNTVSMTRGQDVADDTLITRFDPSGASCTGSSGTSRSGSGGSTNSPDSTR